MMWDNGGWSSAAMGAGAFLMLIFWLMVLAGIVLLVIWAVRYGSRDHGHRDGRYRDEPRFEGERNRQQGYDGHDRGSEDRAVAAARERYARGEIDRDELERVLTTLRETR